MILYIGTRVSLSHVKEINIIKQQRDDITKIVLMNEQEHNYMNFGDENTFNFRKLINWANEKNIEVIIVNGWRSGTPPMHDTSNPKYNCIKEVRTWDTAFFTIAFNSFRGSEREQKSFHLDSSDDIKYTLVSLNNKPHYHRCFMMDLLQKYGLIENQAISWITPSKTSEFAQDREFKYNYWDEKKLVLTDTYQETLNSYAMMPTEYYSSFIQIVNESTMSCDFITEKTTIPLFLKKPFVVFNTRNYNLWLKELGFQLYDEIFDYSFDSIENFEDRFESGVKEISRINSMTRQQQFALYQQVIPKLEYNRQLAIEYVTKFPDIVKPIAIDTHADYSVRLFDKLNF